MARGIDAVLERLSGGAYDARIGFDGDFQTADFFDTAIITSLMTDRRANEAEVLESHKRRGWIGNEYTPGFELGSKLWMFEQSRLTRTTMNSIAEAARDALQWLVDDGFAVAIRSVSVKLAPPSSPVTGMILEIEIQRSLSVVERRYYDLWITTGTGVGQEKEGVGEGAEPDNKSVHNDNGYNYMRTPETALGLGNKWSIAVWGKMVGDAANTNNKVVVGCSSTTGALNRIWIGKSGAAWDSPSMGVTLTDNAGVGTKSFGVDNVWTLGDWKHVVVTFDGTLPNVDQLTVYVDGSGATITGGPGVSTTMSNSTRSLHLGKGLIAFGDWVGCYDFRYYETMAWNAKLGQDAVEALYNGGNPRGLNPNANFGGYTHSSNLLYYLQHGRDPTKLGYNWVTGGGVNLTDWSGLDASDIVDDYPGL